MAAMCVAILSVGSLFESLDVSLAILAGAVILIAETEYGPRTALAVFFVSGFLSLLLPLKNPAFFFLALPGWYPIAQRKLNLLSPFLSRLFKTLILNFVLLFLLVLSALVTGTQEAKIIYLSLLALGNACFVLYDILLDRFLIWYLLKLRNRLHLK